jgi:hypothetical protein
MSGKAKTRRDSLAEYAGAEAHVPDRDSGKKISEVPSEFCLETTGIWRARRADETAEAVDMFHNSIAARSARIAFGL